jgi:hypothetical protein
LLSTKKRALTRSEQILLDEKKRQLAQRREELKEGLPHLYGHKWYFWQRAFINSRCNMRLFSAANQVGKSSVHQWDKIERATNIVLHKELWGDRKPDLFWFWMTDQATLNREFNLKWRRWLPQGKFKDSAQYGWTVEADKREKEIKGINFNSGIFLEYKLFTQSPKNVQSATVFDMAADEEMPIAHWDEAAQRISSTGRYFSAGFTATINQLMWWRALEGKGDAEKFPNAFKQQISKFDCLVFDDGSPGLYTEEQIYEEIANCSSQAQINRRIYGKFAPEAGLKYHAFDPGRHYIDPKPIPSDWLKYSGVDIGSGGDKNHPGAFYFIAVRPDMQLGYVYKGRRLDDEQTTAGDILNFYLVERGQDEMTDQVYDYHAKDFGTIAERAGESFSMANKSHDLGEDVINTLFANDMLFLFDTQEVRKIGEEMLTLMKQTDKRKAIDDACDSTRYALVSIPWDWTAAVKKINPVEKKEEKQVALTKEEHLAEEIRQRRGSPEEVSEDWRELGDEIDFWNSMYSS